MAAVRSRCPMTNGRMEFSPRSLVGMTMGARKRASGQEFDAAKCPAVVKGIKDRMQWYRLTAVIIRAKYRIGECLRPCWCCACGWCIHSGPNMCKPKCDETGTLPAGPQSQRKAERAKHGQG